MWSAPADKAVNFVDTFKAPEPGYVGAFYNNKLYYFSTAAQPTCAFRSLSTVHHPIRTENLLMIVHS